MFFSIPFSDQEGGMLDYYDLSKRRDKKNKKKNINQEERNKQKIFELTEITIPDFWVIPPASPSITLVCLIASKSDVLPWSTCPITTITGGMGRKYSICWNFS